MVLAYNQTNKAQEIKDVSLGTGIVKYACNARLDLFPEMVFVYP